MAKYIKAVLQLPLEKLGYNEKFDFSLQSRESNVSSAPVMCRALCGFQSFHLRTGFYRPGGWRCCGHSVHGETGSELLKLTSFPELSAIKGCNLCYVN